MGGRQVDDDFPGAIIAPMGDTISDSGGAPEPPDFVQKDNVGWRKVADIRDGWERFTQAVERILGL